MRILIPGSTASSAFETACAKQFRSLGHEVLQFETKPRRLLFGKRRWWDMSHPVRFASDCMSSFQLVQKARRFQPDLLFFSKCDNIFSQALTVIRREVSTKIAIWNWDNPFHANVSSYQVLRHIQKADIYFIWAKYLIDPLISAGAKRVEFLPFAFDPEAFPDIDIPPGELSKWQSDVCFVGTWDKEREAALLPLAAQGFDLAIYGQGWTRFLPQDSRLRPHVRADAIYMRDVVKAFKGAKIVLNLLRQHNWKGHNFRTMEAAGIGGGALATPWTADQAEVLFKEGKEILCYPGQQPSVAWLQAELQSPFQLKEIAILAKQRIFQEHLLCWRCKKILESIFNL